MNTRRTMLAKVAWALLAAAWVAGCGAPAVKGPDGGTTGASPAPAPAPPPVSSIPDPAAARPVEPVRGLAEQELVKGFKSYEDGDYKSAARQLQAALNFGLAGRAEQVKAHKYLAFINCVSSRIAACRDEFRKAFAIDPQFDLEPAEAGHPIWGPVFRSVKADAAKPPRK
jgi:hypothetical protein